MAKETQIVYTGGCGPDCGGRCLFRAHVKDGVIVRVETDDGKEPQLKACARGRAIRHIIYAPDRLQFPLKNVGEKGAGKFERISWDEALDTIASRLKQIKQKYGPASIMLAGLAGYQGILHPGYGGAPGSLRRLFNMFGGCTLFWGGLSAEGSTFASRATYGTMTTGHDRRDFVNSKMMLMWGWNPMLTIWSTGTPTQLIKAKEAGTRVVCVDPRFTETAAVLADEWIPIKPGTDAAMMAAMAYVMIKEKLHDAKFLDKCTVGFDKFSDYITGKEDGVPKTPAWAEAITGVKAKVIETLARDYATIKPAALVAGYAAGRSAYGEQYHRMAMALAAMTGNVGISGGNPAGFERGLVGAMIGPTIPSGKNPVEAGGPSLSGSLDTRLRSQKRIHNSRIWDAILEGKAGGFPADIKAMYVVQTNFINQFPNANKAARALKQLEFMVVHEKFMTPTARYADIVLPIVGYWEKDDILPPWISGNYFVFEKKLIEPLHESKTDFDIYRALADRLGIKDFSDTDEVGWLPSVVKEWPDISQNMTSLEKFKQDGVLRIKVDRPPFAFEKEVKDPEHHPFETPSGKIEIYSQQLADLKDPLLPAIPKYIPSWEGPSDPITKDFPLQVISPHSKLRTHSSLYNIPMLRNLDRQTVWINPEDAKARGIADNDKVKIYNTRGTVVIEACVTERIMPGVIALREGAWYEPDEAGIDRGGCPNTLTRDVHSPGGSFCSNTCLAQVEKV